MVSREDVLNYFAYGSNMSLARLGARVPGVRRLGLFALQEHSLRFHKRSRRDGSGKCDAWYTGRSEDRVLGALFEIDPAGKRLLDRFEGLGLGYVDKSVEVADFRGRRLRAVTYCAIDTQASLKPYSWYLAHVLIGARETGVPAAYLAAIEAVESMEDPDRERDARERAIHS